MASKVNLGQCSKQLPSDKWGLRYHNCPRPAIIECNGKLYCKIHSPEYINKKRLDKEAEEDNRRCKKCGNLFNTGYENSCFKFCPICGTKR